VDANTTRQTFQRPGQYISLGKKLRQLLQRVNPHDVLTTGLHSRDFKNSRAEYLSIRIRTLALVFALLAPLWIPIDYAVMENGTFLKFLVLRLGFSAAFLALAMWGTQCNLLTLARVRIALFIAIPGLFYLASHSILPNGGDNAILLGYSFLPLLIMALMTIVPLTLLEGLAYLILIVAFFITTQLLGQTLFTLAALSELWLLLLLGAIALWVQVTQLHMLMRLYREATRDALTGLVNRRVLSARINDDLASHQNNGHPLCVMLFDLDLFKRINDTHGHHTGDVVLQAFAGILHEHCKDDIVAGRYGGEEFLAILPHCSVGGAKELAEAIRDACHHVSVYNNDNEEVTFTTSVGVAQLKPGENADALLARVDEGLYRAKAGGRDLVAVAD
jgi:diguanylate cyclase (GGDEF)-like protein